ncbi:MAG: hypothetical protein CM1200mP1_16960 [Candidatus Neomarinimicrobiota bacterium]|nr:MAG: hypothetical protein CM1200mP1_16960 [Candidatus Neomarinimicrobiota bacterium]
MVVDSPKEKEIVDDLFKFIGSYPLVAHNTPFDLSFLKAMASRQIMISGEKNIMIH